MNAVRGLLDQQVQLNAAVANQMRGLKKNGRLRTRDYESTVNPKIMQDLLSDLTQVNAEIKAATDARKKAQRAHCCFRLKSTDCCGKNQEGRWTINLLKLQGVSILIGGVLVGVNLVLKEACKDDLGLTTSAIALTAIAVGGIANMVMSYELRHFNAVEDDIAEAILRIRPPSEVNFATSIFLCTLENFKNTPNCQNLSECLKAWSSLSSKQREKMSNYAQEVGELIYYLPEEEECRQLVNEIYRLVAIKAQRQMSSFAARDDSATIEIMAEDTTDAEIPIAIAEGEVKQKAEDHIIQSDPDIDAKIFKEYQENWLKLEKMLGVNFNQLQTNDVCYNKAGVWWINDPSQREEEKKIANYHGDLGDDHANENDLPHHFRAPIPFEISIFAPTKIPQREPSRVSRTASVIPLQTSQNPSPRLGASFWRVPLAPSLSNPSASPRALLTKLDVPNTSASPRVLLRTTEEK